MRLGFYGYTHDLYDLEFIDWKALGGEYLQANMYKVGVDTMNAINIIAKKSG